MPPAQSPAQRALICVLVTALTIGLAGCWGGETAVLEERVVTVTLDDYAIMPQDISVREGRVRFVASNAGRLTHNLRVEEPDDGTEPLGGTETAQPGDTVRTTVDLEPGTYLLRCSLANHDDLGMTGKLVVRAGD
jgi:uncharacterized cupredoxin-like copper-binding protein